MSVSGTKKAPRKGASGGKNGNFHGESGHIGQKYMDFDENFDLVDYWRRAFIMMLSKRTKKPLTYTSQGRNGIRQRLILPGRVQPSTFSTGELNFCVRDGNRWNLSVIATGNGSYLYFLSCTLTTAHRMILQTISN